MQQKRNLQEPNDALQKNWLSEIKQAVTPAGKVDKPVQERIAGHINTCSLALDHFYSSSLFFLLDSSSMEYLFVSRSTQAVLGYNRDEIIVNGFQWLFSLLSPQELAYKKQVVADIFTFLKPLGREKIMQATVKYDIVCQRKDGKYIHLLEELMFPEVTEQGDPLLLSCFLHNIGDYISNPKRQCNIYLQTDEGLQTMYSKTYSVKDDENMVLSKRELQVLEQFSNGLSTNLVAEKLFVAPSTVKTHRKNILLKLGVQNTAEAVKYCIKKRWIS